jgi:hypothetical protein
MLDYSLIKDEIQFKRLCEEILIKKGYLILSKEQNHKEYIVAQISTMGVFGLSNSEKVLVECIYVTNNQIVNEDYLKNIIERTTDNFCTRFILMTNAITSISAESVINNINNSSGIKAMIFAKDEMERFLKGFPGLLQKYFNKSKGQKSRGKKLKNKIIIHAHPDFSDELKKLVSDWNKCQDRATFVLVRPSQSMEMKLLGSGMVETGEASVIADKIRKEAGFKSKDCIVVIYEKRLRNIEYDQLFSWNTNNNEDPPNTATISVQFMRILSNDIGNNNLLLLMILVTMLSAISNIIGLEYHKETKGCIMDFCNNMEHILFSINNGVHYCEECKEQIREMGLDHLIPLSLAANIFMGRNSDNISEINNVKTSKDSCDYIISYSGEDRKIAEFIADKLIFMGIKVYYADYEKYKTLGTDLLLNLSDIINMNLNIV